MKCIDCNYKEINVNGSAELENNIKCELTKEEHEPSFDCNCEYIRVRRDNEARLLAEKEAAAETITALREKLSGSMIDLEYVYKALHEIREVLDTDAVDDLLRYVEAFL